eukprot:TRINITY_DN15116_c0_g1_i2.p1 TRINITY_DN15116_c0_g1~~TRINITY_DN15116_c0_g1_i2.p1  ORF type:complete len:779 (-),score=190.20 TRINITY_DN15116_c0_g1_i2:68-2404(-)
MTVWVWFNPFFAFAAVVVNMVAFSFLRKKYARFYMPKTFVTTDHWKPKDPDTRWGWVKEVYYFSDEKLLQNCGLDTVLYLHFLKYACLLFAAMTPFGLIVLLPINSSHAEAVPDDALFLSGMDQYSMAHIKDRSSLFWAHLVSVCINTSLVVAFVWKMYHTWRHWKIKDGSTDAQHDFHSRTVFVRGLPPYCKTNDDLRSLFCRLMGEDRVVHTVMLPQNIGELHALKEHREHRFKKWIRSVDYLHENILLGKRLTHRVNFIDEDLNLTKGTVVDDIEYYKKHLAIMDEKIADLQKEYNNSRKDESSGCGFVTFDSISTALMASQTLLHHNRIKIKARLAPSVVDIDWGWFVRSTREFLMRRTVVIALLVALFIFWSIPVSAVAAAANIDSWAKHGWLKPLVDELNQHEVLKGFLMGFLPSCSLSFFILILPYLLRIILQPFKYLMRSKNERTLLRIFWFFLVLNVFLISVLANTYFSVIRELIDNPQMLFTIFGTSIPRQALYFANWIIFEGFVSYSFFFFCRMDEFSMWKFRSRFVCKTVAEREDAHNPIQFDFAVQYSRELFVFCIGLNYSSMSPLILPFVVVYYAFAYMSAKNNFIYVYSPPKRNLKMLRIAMNRVLVSTIIYHIVMIGVFGIKSFEYGGLVGIPLIGVIIGISYIKRRYHLPTKYLALNNCIDKKIDTQEDLEAIQQMYMHPSLKPPTRIESIPGLRIPPSVDVVAESMQTSFPLLKRYKESKEGAMVALDEDEDDDVDGIALENISGRDDDVDETNGHHHQV